MSEVRCNYTGIVYKIEDGANLGLIVGMRHPLANMNTLKGIDWRRADAYNMNFAAGAIISILRHHGLLLQHSEDSAYKVHDALVSKANNNKVKLGKLVVRLLANERILSKSKCKFNLDAVYSQGQEVHQEEQYFVQCFKSWINEVLPPTMQSLEDALKAKTIRSVEQELDVNLLEFEDGTVYELQEAIVGMANALEDNACRVIRRMNKDTVEARVKQLLLTVTKYRAITDGQRLKLYDYINKAHIPNAIMEKASELMFNRAMQECGEVQKKLLEARGWLRGYGAALRDVLLELGDLPVSETEAKGELQLTAIERLKLLKAKGKGVNNGS